MLAPKDWVNQNRRVPSESLIFVKHMVLGRPWNTVKHHERFVSSGDLFPKKIERKLEPDHSFRRLGRAFGRVSAMIMACTGTPLLKVAEFVQLPSRSLREGLALGKLRWLCMMSMMLASWHVGCFPTRNKSPSPVYNSNQGTFRWWLLWHSIETYLTHSVTILTTENPHGWNATDLQLGILQKTCYVI